MINLIKVIFFLSALFPFARAFGEDKESIVDLKVLSPESQKKILEKFPALTTEEDFQLGVLDQVIQTLIIDEEFDYAEFNKPDANAIASSKRYSLSVGKNKRISRIQISGNESLSDTLVRREFALTEKSRFDQESLIDGVERIRKLYEDNGFPNSIVDLEFFKVSDAEIEIQVKITEGARLLITAIDIRTDNLALKANMEKLLKEFHKEAFTDRQLGEIRDRSREYFSSKKFFKADLTGPQLRKNKEETEVALGFGIEHPYRYNLKITGYRRESRANIDSALDLDHFFSANPSIGPELANKIKLFYLKLGYARVEVSSEETPGKEAFDRNIELKIEEGPKIQISSILFTGNLSLKSDQYADRLKTFSTELLQDGFYNREDLDVALKNLLIDRQNEGFLKAKVNSTRTSYNDRKDEISIVINFDEGPLTQLESVAFIGNSSFTPEQLRLVVGLNPGEPLRLNLLESSIEKLSAFYRNSGYLEMSLTNEKTSLITYSSENTLAQVRYEISEGPQVRVASIVIEGNSLTKDNVIRKELEFNEGDVLTPALIEESKSRLQRLGHFTAIEIRTLEEKTKIADRTVIVTVADRDPGLVNFGVGVNNERELTIRGFTGVAYRNIYGTGRGVSARLEGNYNIADIKYLENQITLGYLEPYLFDSRVRGRINVTRSVTVSNYTKGREEYRQINQTNYLLEEDLTSNVLLIYELWGLATVKDAPIKEGNTAVTSEELNIGTTGPTLEIDYRDHPFSPTKGSFTRVNIEYGSPELSSTDTIKYLRSFASYTHYLPFHNQTWVWANSFRFGYLKNLSDQKWGDRTCPIYVPGAAYCNDTGVPYDKKGLLLGGQSTLRGFTLSDAFPNSLDGIDSDYLLKSEAQSYMIKSELRFPIPLFASLGGALFYEGGMVLIQGVDFADPYRDCVGFGLRISTPVGALSADIGFKLDARLGDASKDRGDESKSAFHLSIGTF